MAEDEQEDHNQENMEGFQENQCEEFSSTQQLIKLCQEKEKATAAVGGSNRVVMIKNNSSQQEDTFLGGINDNCEDQTTTGGDRSLLSEESQVVVKTVDLQGHGFIMCSLKFNTPVCLIDVKIRDFDYINVIADQIYQLGEFTNPEMKEAIFIYLQQQLAKAHAIRI